MKDNSDKREAIRRSALWAAYGDAMGFITELTDKKGLKWRTDKSRVVTTIPWKQKIGGQLGVIVELPAGCYSDDTQLRIATCRAIRGDGRFDVEAFAKVELPVWLSYAFGAGRGTKTAAASMTRKDTTWSDNFFDTKTSRYVDCGGNGAATRIQPHVWAAADLKNVETFLPDVLKNAVCTHGHPRAILGAVFHSLCIAYTLLHKKIPGPGEWRNFIATLYKVPELIRNEPELFDYWLPTWDKTAESNLELSCKAVAEESLKDIGVIQLIRETAKNSSDVQYATIVREIGGMSDEYRGCGTKTAILSAALAWMFKSNPRGAVEIGCNLLGSDTDTISSMTGAIIGSVANYDPPGEICDEKYIEEEAFRMSAISNGLKAESFIYPDLFNWDVGSVQSDFVKTDGDRLVVSGLGYAEALGEFYKLKADDEVGWQWLKLNIGQKILAKRRVIPDVVPSKHLATEIEPEELDLTIVEITEEITPEAREEKKDKPAAIQKQTMAHDKAARENKDVSSGQLAPKVEKEKPKPNAAKDTQEVLSDKAKKHEVKPAALQKQTIVPDKAAKKPDADYPERLVAKIEKEKPKPTAAKDTKEVLSDKAKKYEVKPAVPEKLAIETDKASKEPETVISEQTKEKIEKEKPILSTTKVPVETIVDTGKKQEVKPDVTQKQPITAEEPAKEVEVDPFEHEVSGIEEEPSTPPFVGISQEPIPDAVEKQESKPDVTQKQPIAAEEPAKEVEVVSFKQEVSGIEEKLSKPPSVGISQGSIPDAVKKQEAKPDVIQKQPIAAEEPAKEVEVDPFEHEVFGIEEEPLIPTSVGISQETIPDAGEEQGIKPADLKKKPLTLDQATKEAIDSGFDPTVIGRMLLEFSERNDGVEMAIGFSAIIAKIHRAKNGKL